MSSGELWFNTPPARHRDGPLSPHPPQSHHSDVHRNDAARVLPDPHRPGGPDRDDGRRARDRCHAPRDAAQGIRTRSTGHRAVWHLHRACPARRPRQVDDHAGAGRARVRGPFPGHDRARALRDRVRADRRHSGGDARRRAPQFRVRSRRHGCFADRLFDADLLVGTAADPAVFRTARLDTGVRPHRGQVLHRARHRVPYHRCAAVRAKRVPFGRRFPTSSCR